MPVRRFRQVIGIVVQLKPRTMALSETTPLAHVGDPDLLIRTGGEMRISNFLLWQSAYSEFVFTERLWPDFSEADIDAAIQAYRQRDRRYGGLAVEELLPQGL